MSRFWQSLRGRFLPAVDEAALPRSLVERFASCPVENARVAFHSQALDHDITL